MKPLLRLFSVLLLIIILTSCSTCRSLEDLCLGVYELGGPIKLYNFQKGDLDTVIIKKYGQGSNFLKLLDSNYVSAEYIPNGPPSYEINTNNMSIDNDWEIYLPEIKQKYRISNFSITKIKCDKCDKTPQEDVIQSYSVNGKMQQGSSVSIYK